MTDARGAAPHSRGGAHGAERGFILAMLLVLITGVGVLLTIALPSVKAEVQREQEAELIFRGEAIANAIKTYKAKTGAYPLKLEDLAKVRPRILRKVYLDPMTHDGDKEGEWDLITAVSPGASGDKSGLPIVGVRSRCQKDSFKIYMGKTLVSDWAFSAADNLLGVPGAAALGALTGTPATSATTAAPAKPARGTNPQPTDQ